MFAFIRVLYGSILLGTVREYINQSTKIVRLECHLRFNYECLNNNVVPRSLHCKTLVDTPYGRTLARNFSRNCLKARMQDNKQEIQQDTRLREAGAEVVYCLAQGTPQGPNLPRDRLNHQDALFLRHGKATHSQTWAGEPAWLGVRGDATLQTPAFTDQLCRNSKLTLEEALVLVRQHEDSETEQKLRESVVPSGTTALNIDEAKVKRHRPPRQARAQAASGSSPSLCVYCGRSPHPHTECPASKASCNLCHKKGHFAAVCRSKKCKLASIELGAVSTATRPRSKFVEVKVDRLALSFKVDSGAEVSVIPKLIRGDNGPQFAAQEFADFARDYGFKHVTSSPRYPQSNGEVGRAVRTIKGLFSKNDDPFLALLVFRDTPGPSGFSPAQQLMGQRLRTSLPKPSEKLTPEWLSTEVFFNKDKADKRRQATNFNRRRAAKELRPLTTREDVWVTDVQCGAKVLSEAQRPRSYVVETPRGVLQRNRKHLEPYKTPVVPAPEPPYLRESYESLAYGPLGLQQRTLSRPAIPDVVSQRPLDPETEVVKRSRYGRAMVRPKRLNL
ncbi:uncharacterized protein ISCGN_010400 [Ixodes scapularis]